MKPLQKTPINPAGAQRIGTTPVQTPVVDKSQAKPTTVDTNPEPAQRADGSLAPMHDQVSSNAGVVQARVTQSQAPVRRRTRGRTSTLKVTSTTALLAQVRRPQLRAGLSEVLQLQGDIAAALNKHAVE